MQLPLHPAEHWARVKREVAGALDEVPLYAGRAAPPSGDSPEEIAAWLASMPRVGKRELRRGFPKSLTRRTQDLKAEMARGTVEIIATSGTTENRLQVLWEWSWWDPQEREAMRLNARVRATMAEGLREAVLTTPVCGGATCHIGNLTRAERTIDGMLFLNQSADPTHWNDRELGRMLDEWNELAPLGVEADPAYLAALCRHASARAIAMASPRYVSLTYEQTTRAHRRAIGERLASPLFQLYGATEAGVLFMECERGKLHHNARHSHIELVDDGAPGDGLGRVLVTTLGRAWMPLVRYDVGDYVRLAKEARCACGLETNGYLLERVEGRVADTIAAGARRVTPAMLDDAIDAAERVDAWQLAVEPSGYTLRVVGGDGTRAAQAVSELLSARVEARREVAIVPEGSGKYRLVRA